MSPQTEPPTPIGLVIGAESQHCPVLLHPDNVFVVESPYDVIGPTTLLMRQSGDGRICRAADRNHLRPPCGAVSVD